MVSAGVEVELGGIGMWFWAAIVVVAGCAVDDPAGTLAVEVGSALVRVGREEMKE